MADTRTGSRALRKVRLRAAGRKAPTTPLAWVEAMRQGLPAGVLAQVAGNLRLTQSELAGVTGIPERTLIRRKREGVLSPDESAKVHRLSRVLERATEVFADRETAVDWMKTRNRSLEGTTPLSLLDTEIGAEIGAEIVLDTLGRIEHGIFT